MAELRANSFITGSAARAGPAYARFAPSSVNS
jgi:hypothetical protein